MASQQQQAQIQSVFSQVIAAAPHITLPGQGSGVSTPLAPVVTNVAGPPSGVQTGHTNVIANAANSAVQQSGFFSALFGRLSAWRQGGVPSPGLTGGSAGSAHSSVPSILGGVQGFTLPPGIPNSVANRY